MRTWVIIGGLLVVSCGGTRPPPPQPAPTADRVPVLSAVEPEERQPLESKPVLSPARRLTVAWHTANAGKSTLTGNAVTFRGDGSLAVIGQGEAERWTSKPNKKLAKWMPHFVGSLDASGKPEWVRTIDVGNGWTKGVASGPDGSVLVTGSFEKKLRIEGKVVATAAGETDIFVARFERDGRVAWAVSAGSPQLDLANGIAVAADGSSYVVGSLKGSAKFGDLTTRPLGDRDVFVAAFDPKGAAQWVSTAGGADSDEAFAVALTDKAVCATGYFGGEAKFQSVTLTMPPADPSKIANPSNAFVVCHARSGDVQWAERLGTHTSWDRGWDIAALADGSMVVTGDIAEKSFVARYAAGGKQLWLRHSTGNSTARAVVPLADDEVLVATYLVGADLTLPGRTRTATVRAKTRDTVLAHYTASGEVLAAGQIAGQTASAGDERNGDEVEVGHLAVSSTGRISAIGRLWGTAAFVEGDLLVPSPATITGSSGTDLILVVLDPLTPARP